MEFAKEKGVLPEIVISKASSPVNDSYGERSPVNEPEMEDVHDSSLVRNLIEELGIEESACEDLDPLKHNPQQGESCLHCILVNKVQALQSDIARMNHEIESTAEILNLKKEQNGELKEMILRLEQNFEIDSDTPEIDNKGVRCTCMQKCAIF